MFYGNRSEVQPGKPQNRKRAALLGAVARRTCRNGQRSRAESREFRQDAPRRGVAIEKIGGATADGACLHAEIMEQPMKIYENLSNKRAPMEERMQHV